VRAEWIRFEGVEGDIRIRLQDAASGSLSLRKEDCEDFRCIPNTLFYEGLPKSRNREERDGVFILEKENRKRKLNERKLTNYGRCSLR